MRHFIQWLCGYIQVCLRGRQINRFLNLCSKNGIALWRISYDLSRNVRAHVRLKDFYYLKPYLKKTKTQLRILKRKGFPFWCYRHPRLKWMLFGAFFALCILIYSFSFVWEIKISGNFQITNAQLMHYLNEQEIITGKKRKDINCTEIEYLLRQNFDSLSWVSVYLDHTSLCIEIKESLYDEFLDYPIEDGRQYDLVANKDAYIYSMVTRSGTPAVKERMSVKKGDILVIGKCEIYDDIGEIKDTLKVCADALIFADVTYEFIEPLSEIEIVSLRLTDSYSNRRLYAIAEWKLNEFVEKLEQNGVIILDKNVKIDRIENRIVFSGEIKAREQIGINIPVEEVWEYEFE